MGRTIRVLVAVGLLAAKSACTQAVPSAAAIVLQQMASHAGVIFSGQVVEVTRNDAAGFVDIRFHVDDAVRGCPKTGFYVLREWAGLWSAHPDRYITGQRLLMLLTARGPAGMSAPLGGMDGAIPLVAAGTEPLANGTGVAPAEDRSAPLTFVADLRWIQARAVRSTGSASNRLQAQVQAQSQPVAIGPALPFSSSSGEDWGPIGALNPATKETSTSATATLSAVMALLRSPNGASDARY